MAKMRSSVALFLTIVNIIGEIAILSLSIIYLNSSNNYKSYSSSIRQLSLMSNTHSNLRGTKSKLMKMKSAIHNQINRKGKIYDPSYFIKDKFIISDKAILENTSKSLRNLSQIDSPQNLIISIELLSIFITCILISSFYLTENECCNIESQEELGLGCCIGCCLCDGCCDCRGSGDCDCNGGGGDSIGGIIIGYLFILVFIALYYILKSCGKHVSRYFSITFLFINNLIILYLSSVSIYEFGYSDAGLIFPICIISGLLVVSNFLGLLLPNLSCCKNLTYGYRSNINENNNKPLINNKILPIVPVVDNVNIGTTTPIDLPVSTQQNYQPTTPAYIPQVPIPDLPSFPKYEQQIPQNNPQYSSDFGYNSGKGGIYAAPPVPQAYPQPQSIYDVNFLLSKKLIREKCINHNKKYYNFLLNL